MFRLLKRNKSLNIIFETFIVTLPALANVGCLLLLFLYIYSILGMNIFSTIKHSYELNAYANFETVPTAMLTLIRISTGENWHKILFGIINEPGILNNCIPEPTYEDYKNNLYEPVGCGRTYIGIAFFFTYIMIVQLIFLNLFIAIIL